MAMMNDDFDRAHWPFRATFHDSIGWSYYMSATDRIAALRGMTDVEQVRAALHVPGVQLTVERAIYKRLRELEAV